MAKPAATSKKTKPLSKSEILKAISDGVGAELSAKHVKSVVEHLVAVGHKELKKAGVFVLHGFAKFTVVKKPAKPASKGINPFTKLEQTFAAKPQANQ
jgi:DNA-binding protein HU-beta